MQQATKRRLILLGLVATGLIIGGALTLRPPPARPELTIEMWRTPGFGGSHNYHITIDPSGNVSYEASTSSSRVYDVKGSAKLTPQQIDELVAAIKKADVFALKDIYHFGWTDKAWMLLYIRLNGRTKDISHYPALHCDERQEASPPQALCDLECAIQATANLGELALPAPSCTSP